MVEHMAEACKAQSIILEPTRSHVPRDDWRLVTYTTASTHEDNPRYVDFVSDHMGIYSRRDTPMTLCF